MSLFETKCPICNGTLWIDPSTLKIIDHRAADHHKADLQQFLKESKRDRGWDEKMRMAREEEARRKAAIEEKFRNAKKNTDINDASEAGPRSVLDWD